jgi:hypothetical protein
MSEEQERDALAFHGAMMARYERNDIAPLQAYLRSDRPLSSANRASLAALVDLLHAGYLHAIGHRRKAGKPGGKHLRWQNPIYVATFLVGQRMEQWKRDHGKRGIPGETVENFVDAMIEQMKDWASMRGKRFDGERIKERILTLLREPKNRRL